AAGGPVGVTGGGDAVLPPVGVRPGPAAAAARWIVEVADLRGDGEGDGPAHPAARGLPVPAGDRRGAGDPGVGGRAAAVPGGGTCLAADPTGPPLHADRPHFCSPGVPFRRRLTHPAAATSPATVAAIVDGSGTVQLWSGGGGGGTTG